MKKYIAFTLVFAMCLLMAPNALALESEHADVGIVRVEGKYHAEDILNALTELSKSTGDRSITSQEILSDVLRPASFDIAIPNINPSKVYQTIDVYTLDPAFAAALEAHGINRTSMTYSEFEALENTWILPPEFIVSVKNAYPELVDVDLSTWTYGMYKQYSAEKDKERLINSLDSSILKQLNARGIQISDINTLLKEYHSVESILAQSNKSLKSTLETAYQFTYDYVLEMTKSVRSTPPSAYYTYVVFPRYMNGEGDYFHNSVLTTTYWQGIQADRALLTQNALYGVSSDELKCTNMYGTYSYSQGGAHEGIDFTHPSGSSTPIIYAVFEGEKLNGTAAYHLAVYDEYSVDGPKTYSYYHMSSITAGSTVNVWQNVGRQGNVGGSSNGYHVHFEVHSGEKNYIVSGADHYLTSISPYRLHTYIGCTGNHINSWRYDNTHHWTECHVCKATGEFIPHTFQGGICYGCGMNGNQHN